MKARALVATVCLALSMAADAAAHVGSPDVVQEATAGPYRLLITVRPPAAIPGRAAVDVQVLAGDVRRVTIVPLPLTGEGARHPPVPDEAAPDPGDARSYHGLLWLMQVGAWQVRVQAIGDAGAGTASVPVPALARTVRPMTPALTGLLFVLMALLVAGVLGIARAAAREGTVAAGASLDARHARNGRVALAIAAVLAGAALLGGWRWWGAEARSYGRQVYRPLDARAALTNAGTLRLELSDPGWLRLRKLDDLLPDHGHPMHLFAIRWPDLDAVAHVHPDELAAGLFERRLPALPAGRYRLFADIVHATGLDETVTTELDLPPGAPAAAPEGDDSAAQVPEAASAGRPRFAYAGGGGALTWTNPGPLRAGVTTVLQFAAETADGRPAAGLEPYMGMAGHAMFVRRDGGVFAHVHPTGSVPMAALQLAQGTPAHLHHQPTLPPAVSFPYRFPAPGDYRLFVQTRRDGAVRTAAFDLRVDQAR